jgi:hypothetical protein
MMCYLYCQNPVHCSAVVAVIYLLRVVYEPFSNIHGGLQNKIAIENFLKVSIMANEGLEKTIRFEDNKEDTITAIVIFEREGRIKGKFVFHFVIESIPSYSGRKKIKSLRIRFLD